MDLGAAAGPVGLKQSGSGQGVVDFGPNGLPVQRESGFSAASTPSPNCWGHPKDEPGERQMWGDGGGKQGRCTPRHVPASIHQAVRPSVHPSVHASHAGHPAILGVCWPGRVNAEHPLKGRDVPGSRTSHPNPLKMSPSLPTIPSCPSFPCLGFAGTGETPRA